jgi:hypothetical protein
MTPGGRPAACSSSISTPPLSTAVEAGFHTTVLPHSAGAVGRLPAIEVKLNGVTANTKPSSGRYSSRFHAPGADCGCSRYSWVRKWTLYWKKSMSSQAASISAWWAVFDWPTMVAALRRSRNSVRSRAAARRKMAARSSQASAAHSARAAWAAVIASATSIGPAWWNTPSGWRRRCGTISGAVFPVRICLPPIHSGTSCVRPTSWA